MDKANLVIIIANWKEVMQRLPNYRNFRAVILRLCSWIELLAYYKKPNS